MAGRGETDVDAAAAADAGADAGGDAEGDVDDKKKDDMDKKKAKATPAAKDSMEKERDFAHVTFNDENAKKAALRLNRLVASSDAGVFTSVDTDATERVGIGTNYLRIREPSNPDKRKKADAAAEKRTKAKAEEKKKKREARNDKRDSLPKGFKNAKFKGKPLGKDRMVDKDKDKGGSRKRPAGSGNFFAGTGGGCSPSKKAKE